MAISINWASKVIFVPKADTQLLVAPPPQEIRQLDLNWFRLELKALESSADGMPFDDTHFHNPPVSIGGAILARVVGIINGYTVTFEDGAYAVNLVGANSNVGDVTNVNQVSVRPQNSVGLQDLSSLQAASYQGVITIDVDNGIAGTLFPIGTSGTPVNNLTDALAISATRGIKRFELASNLTLDQDISEVTFAGASSHFASILDLNGHQIDSVGFKNMKLTGTGGGSFQAEQCLFTMLSLDPGSIAAINCGVVDHVDVGDNSTIFMADCYSFVAGTATPQFHLGNNSTLQLRGWTGGAEILSFDSTDVGSVDLLSGHVVLNSSCTGGTLVVRGTGYITDNSGLVTLVTDGLNAPRYVDPDGKLQKTLLMARKSGAPDIFEEIT